MQASESKVQILRRAIPELESEPGAWPAHWPAVLTRVHASRGAQNASEAMPRLDVMPHFSLLKGIDTAVELLESAIRENRHIVVTADFDCDGATACAVALRGLGMLGAKRVSYAVPDRAIHGYGLTRALVEDIKPLAPDLILTVDHGIACFEGVLAANAAGWQVIVTDHHLPGEQLPAAAAIVNPNQPDDEFPSKALAGVGVMFYVLLALRARMGMPAADLSRLLDLVAVGTVADMVRLDGLNRALVQAGLGRMRSGKVQAGIAAIAAAAGRDLSTVTPTDIGFSIGPRINAAGRLEDMRLGIECLLTDDPARAAQLAQTLDSINSERRSLQQTMVDTGDLLADLARRESNASILCLHDPQWHAGVVGLVASKLKEKLYRPVLAFAPSGNDDGMLRGSARSIPGFHIRDALALVDARCPGLIERFGGHAMAAGLSLQSSHLDAFREALQKVGREWLSPALLQAVIETDGPLSAHEINAATTLALRDGGVWGQAYPEPQFDDVFDVVSHRVLKDKHLKLVLRKENQTFNAIQFNAPSLEVSSRVRLVYQIALDDWRGGESVQLIVRHSFSRFNRDANHFE